MNWSDLSNTFQNSRPPCLARAQSRLVFLLPPPSLTRRIRLPDLPNDVHFLIMDALLPAWARTPSPNGPTWTVGDLEAPLDITISADSLRSLTLVCRRLGDVATPFLYRTVHMRDIDSLLALWMTLSRLCPSNARHIRHLLVGLELGDWTALCRIINVVLPLVPSEPGPGPGHKPVFRWAEGQALVAAHLYSNSPHITQRVLFDLVRRSVNVVSLALIPPRRDEMVASFCFRRALGAVASSSSFSRANAVVLGRLRVVTLQVGFEFLSSDSDIAHASSIALFLYGFVS